MQGCRGCPLYADATQAVFGEGPVKAELMLVGEQPGDQEDRDGRPFVGPAGRLLDRALADAGIDRTHVYVTNAVNALQVRGARQAAHPQEAQSAGETHACHPWPDAEVDARSPARHRLSRRHRAALRRGPQARVLESRGQWLQSEQGEPVIVTRHPSALLRMLDQDERDRAYQELVEDLQLAARGPAANATRPRVSRNVRAGASCKRHASTERGVSPSNNRYEHHAHAEGRPAAVALVAGDVARVALIEPRGARW